MIKISGEQVNLENTLDIDEKTILENIKDVILKRNDWMEIQEIADILGVERHKQLYSSGHNSTIAQLINRFLKKQGFKTKKIDFDEGAYSISVCAPGIYMDNTDIKPKNIDTDEISDDSEDNEDLNKITELIKKGENLFITGYAGTGKSYILNKLKKIFKIGVTSTTGMAAVNIQGQTIHSWAGVGICNKPIEQVVKNMFKRSKLRKQIINCNILAID